MIFVGLIRPLKDPFENKMEMINEASTLVFLYHLFCFLPGIMDPNGRQFIGYSLFISTLASISFNLGIIFGTSLIITFKNIKIKYIQMANKHQAEEERIKREKNKLIELVSKREDDNYQKAILMLKSSPMSPAL